MVAEGEVPGTPGHGVPAGVELTSAGAVAAWVASMGYGSVIVNGGDDGETYAHVIVEEGYDDLYTLNFTEEELVDLGVKKPHARKMVVAAAAVSRTLGTVGGALGAGARRLGGESGGGGDSESKGGSFRVALEVIPSGEGGKGCGIAGLCSRPQFTLWVATLVGWTRGTLSGGMADCVRSLRLHPGQDVDELKMKVDPGEDERLGVAVASAMSMVTKAHVGASILMEGSGLELCQALFVCVFSQCDDSLDNLLEDFDAFPDCAVQHKLMEWLNLLSDLVDELKILGEVVSDARWKKTMRKGVSKMKEAKEALASWERANKKATGEEMKSELLVLGVKWSNSRASSSVRHSAHFASDSSDSTLPKPLPKGQGQQQQQQQPRQKPRQRQSKGPCWGFQNGNCVFGSDCKRIRVGRSHRGPEGSMAPSSHSRQGETPDQQNAISAPIGGGELPDSSKDRCGTARVGDAGGRDKCGRSESSMGVPELQRTVDETRDGGSERTRERSACKRADATRRKCGDSSSVPGSMEVVGAGSNKAILHRKCGISAHGEGNHGKVRRGNGGERVQVRAQVREEVQNVDVRENGCDLREDATTEVPVLRHKASAIAPGVRVTRNRRQEATAPRGRSESEGGDEQGPTDAGKDHSEGYVGSGAPEWLQRHLEEYRGELPSACALKTAHAPDAQDMNQIRQRTRAETPTGKVMINTRPLTAEEIENCNWEWSGAKRRRLLRQHQESRRATEQVTRNKVRRSKRGKESTQWNFTVDIEEDKEAEKEAEQVAKKIKRSKKRGEG